MNDPAISILMGLGRASLALAIAALAAFAVLRLTRATSPTVHRLLWALTLLAGWTFVRVPVVVPWRQPEGASPSPAVAADRSKPSAAEHVELKVFRGDVEISLDQRPTAASANTDDKVAISTPAVAGEHAPLDARVVSPVVVAPEPDIGLQPHRVEPSPPVFVIPSIPAALVAVWLAGIALSIVAWLWGYLRFIRRLPSGQAADEAWVDEWRALMASRGIRQSIPLRVTAAAGPMLVRTPRRYELLVPANLWRELDVAQRGAIMRHELAHYQRADVWKSLAARSLALPHWFNPAAWWAVRRFDEAAEWACDRAATAEESRAAYARALVRLGESAARHAAYSPAARGSVLAFRIRRLLQSSPREDSIMKKSFLLAAGLCTLAVALVRVELVAREPEVEPEQTKVEKSTSPTHEAGGTSSERTKPAVKIETSIPENLRVGDNARVSMKISNTSKEPIQEVILTLAHADSLDPIVATAGHEFVGKNLVWKRPRIDAGNSIDLVVEYKCVAPALQASHRLEVSSAHDGHLALVAVPIAIEDAPQSNEPTAKTSQESTPANDRAEKSIRDAQRQAVDSARKTVEALQAAYQAATVPLEAFSTWSSRLVDAELAAAETPEQRLKALREYLSRTEMLAKTVEKLHEVGAAGGEAEKLYATKFYVAEAKRRLAEEERRMSGRANLPSPPHDRGGDVRRAFRVAICRPDGRIVKESFRECTGTETVFEALNSLDPAIEPAETKSIFITRPARGDQEKSQVLPVASDKIKDKDARTNWQILPGDTLTIVLTEGSNAGLADAGKESSKANLRFDGKTFDQWREQALTELKPENRIEAIRAFEAFAPRGFGREATDAIVAIVQEYPLATWNRSEKVLSAAREAFSAVPVDDALPALERAAGSGADHEKVFALSVLEQYRNAAKRVAPTILNATKEENPRVRVAALSAAKYVAPDHESYAEALRAGLTSADNAVTAAALSALDWSLGSKLKSGVDRSRIAELALAAEVLKLADRDASQLTTAQDMNIRQGALYQIGRFGPDAHVPTETLMDWLRSADGTSGDASRRDTAIRLIGYARPVPLDAIPLLQKAMRAPEAAQALALMAPDSKEALAALVEGLKSHPHPSARSNAVRALNDLGALAKDAIPALEEAEASGDPTIRDAARESLKRIRKASAEPAPDAGANAGKDRLFIAILPGVGVPYSSIEARAREKGITFDEAKAQLAVEHRATNPK